jgi:HPr kinase/phosphorylase
MSTVHASCVSFGGRGILIRGASGAGKSRLAHILILRGPLYGFEVRLVADDRVAVTMEDGALIGRPPKILAGLLEVRGLGLIRLPYLPQTRLDLVLDILPEREIPRLPAPEDCEIGLNGVTLPRVFAISPESGLDVLLTINGQSGSLLDPSIALASVRFDGKTKGP